MTQLAKEITIDNKVVSLKFWDTAGQEKFRSITRIFYNKSDLGFIVFDLSNSDTAEQTAFWIKEYKTYCPDSSICILGNKSDLVSDQKEESIRAAE